MCPNKFRKCITKWQKRDKAAVKVDTKKKNILFRVAPKDELILAEKLNLTGEAMFCFQITMSCP